MTWIKTIAYHEARGKLRQLYDRVMGTGGQIDQILQVHGLRPHSLQGHMTLYKNVLHHSENQLPPWLLETIALYVSILNHCRYCIEHHFEGLKRLLDDETRCNAIRQALEAEMPELVLDERSTALLMYTQVLTKTPWDVDETHIQQLRQAGYDDGQILEGNQVIAYFAYANRTAMGLGVSAEDEHLGLSPQDRDDPDNWSHE